MEDTDEDGTHEGGGSSELACSGLESVSPLSGSTLSSLPQAVMGVDEHTTSALHINMYYTTI